MRLFHPLLHAGFARRFPSDPFARLSERILDPLFRSDLLATLLSRKPLDGILPVGSEHAAFARLLVFQGDNPFACCTRYEMFVTKRDLSDGVIDLRVKVSKPHSTQARLIAKRSTRARAFRSQGSFFV